MGDYYSAIARAVPNLPNKTDEARRAIYERACTALQESSRTLEISEVEQAKARFLLFQSGAYRLGSNPAPFYGPLFQSPRPVPLSGSPLRVRIVCLTLPQALYQGSSNSSAFA